MHDGLNFTQLPLTVDELIEELESIRRNHGNEVTVSLAQTGHFCFNTLYDAGKSTVELYFKPHRSE